MPSPIIKRIDFDPEFEPVHLFPLIKKDVISSLDQAKNIIDRARKESKRIRSQARVVLEQAVTEKEEERRRGFEEGYQDGLGQLTATLLEIEASKESFFKEAEPQIMRMVMEIAEKIINREVEKGAVIDVIRQAVSQAMGQKLIVRLHPEDVVLVTSREPELLQGLQGRSSVSLREDETIGRGGCVIESEVGTVDARLETQLKAIRKALGL